MEADLTPTPAAEAVDVQPESPEESASPSTAPTQEDAFMNAIIRGMAPDSSSNPDDDGDGDSEPMAADGQPAPTGDVQPTSRQPGRRSRRAEEAAQRLTALEAENAQLQARVAQLDPPPPDATEESRKAILASEQRFRTLDAKPDDDPTWTTDDYVWLQDEKRRRAVVPELREHYDTVIEADRAALRTQHETERQQFWNAVTADMASGADLPGVDMDALKKAPNFASRDRLIYAAAAATRDADIRRLRDENDDLKKQLFGSVRPPLNGGRSAPGRTYDEDGFMNSLMRNGVRA